MTKDRYLAPDVAWAKAAVLDGALSGAVQAELFGSVAVGRRRPAMPAPEAEDVQPPATPHDHAPTTT